MEPDKRRFRAQCSQCRYGIEIVWSGSGDPPPQRCGRIPFMDENSKIVQCSGYIQGWKEQPNAR